MLTSADCQSLLQDLCANLGICPPETETTKLEADPPQTVAQFTDAVLRADGGEPATVDTQLRRQVSAAIQAAFGRIASRDENVDYFVLDTLANDLEGFAGILRLVNHPDVGWTELLGRDFEPRDVMPSLLRLIRAGNVEACYQSDSRAELIGAGDRVVPAIPIEDLSFRMTSRGRRLHSNWNPPEHSGA